jgi:iron complex outermembrane receptor protein
MSRGLPGLALGDQTGNEFQRDINYRGFTASPVIGTPQGLAVYQNGVRVNEVFGDVVNWDFIPETAINRMTLMPSNPVYGLNALGGALSIDMKNGFTYQGTETELRGGSFARRSASCRPEGRSGTCQAISPPTPSTITAGATTRRRICAGSMGTSGLAASKPNFT